VSRDLAVEAGKRAGEYFRAGYNCAESVFLAFRDLAAPGLDAGLVRMFTGLGGGLGQAGCICGALNASALAIGLLKGRTGVDEDRYACYDLTNDFHDLFKECFGGTCCRTLNRYPFDSKERKRNCLKITGKTGKLLMEFLTTKELVKPE